MNRDEVLAVAGAIVVGAGALATPNWFVVLVVLGLFGIFAVPAERRK